MKIYALVREPDKTGNTNDCFRAYPSYNARNRAVLDMIMARAEDSMTPYQLQELNDNTMMLDLPELLTKLNESSTIGTVWYHLDLDVEVPVQPVAEEPVEDDTSLYHVYVQQFVEEVGTVAVLATSYEEAKDKVRTLYETGELPDVDWREGDMVVDFDIYGCDGPYAKDQ